VTYFVRTASAFCLVSSQKSSVLFSVFYFVALTPCFKLTSLTLIIRAALFTAPVLCRASYRVLEYSARCASYSPAAVIQVKVTVRKAVYRRTPDS